MMRHRGLSSTMGMQAVIVLGFALFMTAGAGPAFAAAQWNVGVTGDERGISGFNLSIGEYYDVPQREVVVVHERGIDEEDMPVVFFLSRHAHVAPEAIVNLRLRGMSWMDITLHFGLGPEIYYVPVRDYDHHPRGHAYGYYRDHRRHDDWRKMRLRDDDIVNQVNMRFISEHYRVAPEKVMRYRAEGRQFPAIEQRARKEHQTTGGGRFVYGGQPYWNDQKKQATQSHSQTTSSNKSGKKEMQRYDRQDRSESQNHARSMTNNSGQQEKQRYDRNVQQDRGGNPPQSQPRDHKQGNKDGKGQAYDDQGSRHGKD